jgi:hypothetical protein
MPEGMKREKIEDLRPVSSRRTKFFELSRVENPRLEKPEGIRPVEGLKTRNTRSHQASTTKTEVRTNRAGAGDAPVLIFFNYRIKGESGRSGRQV